MSRKQDYITLVRQSNRKLWEAVNELAALQREWTAMDYGTTLKKDVTDKAVATQVAVVGVEPEPAPVEVPADLAGVGENAGITTTAVGAVVFDTTNAFIALLDTGHATNMAALL